MTRDELITAIRNQTDLDETDLPVGTATLFLEEAFHRTAALNRHWPHCEADWEYQSVDGKFALDATTADIATVKPKVGTGRLVFVDHDQISTSPDYSYGSASLFSLWGGNVHLWPAPADGTEYVVSGWRRPSTEWLTNAALQVDLDVRLHLPLMHYAVGLAYAQQEDPELEMMYLRRWEMLSGELSKEVTSPTSYRPLILNGGLGAGGLP